jgi:hypothetical protein
MEWKKDETRNYPRYTITVNDISYCLFFNGNWTLYTISIHLPSEGFMMKNFDDKDTSSASACSIIQVMAYKHILYEHGRVERYIR